MAPKLCILVCQNILPEATTVVETEGFDDVDLAVFPAHCGHPPLRRGEIEEIVSRCSADGHAVCLLGGCCLAGQKGIPPESNRCHLCLLETCFELLASRGFIDPYLRRGDHLLTPGWLARWREYMDAWDFDRATAREFFGESVRQLVLLDTGTDPQSAAHLQELAEFVALPAEVVPVGLGFFRLFLSKIVLEWRLARERGDARAVLAQANRQAADYAATLDLMRVLAGTATEKEVIDRVFDLFAMFCAPTCQCYLSFVNNEPVEVYTWPDTAAERQPHLLQDWTGDYAWTESGAGFRLRISRHDQLLGILEVEGIRFPEYREYYLNLALNLVDVCALSIANARSFQERQRMTEALRESEMTARALLDVPLDLALLLDEQGRILDANATFAERVGQEKTALIGRSAWDFFPPEVSARRKQVGEQVLQTGRPARLEEERDGIWYDLVIYPVRDAQGRVSKMAVLARDITESKQAQNLLRIKDSAIESSINAIAMSDMEGLLTYTNPSFLQMWGYRTTDEVLGRSVIPFWEAQQHAAQVIEALYSNGGWIGEMVAKKKDGSLFPVQLSAHLVTDAAGNPTGMMASFVDITERKRAEQRLQHYAAELERRNEEIKQFAYIVSHDMRSPLVNLRGFAAELGAAAQVIDQLLETAWPHLDPSQQQVLEVALRKDIPEALDFIDASVTRMDRFTQAVLNLSRLGRRELQLEPVDMEELVGTVLQSLAHQVEARQGQVTVGPLPEVIADHLSMEQIMGNLLTNAVLYLDPQRPGKIEIAAERVGDEDLFWVRDNGVGIAEKDREKVFAPFRRAGSPDVPGEGMGLAYVELLVRRHGGRIWFESEAGVGTTFLFTLPYRFPQGVDYVGD